MLFRYGANRVISTRFITVSHKKPVVDIVRSGADLFSQMFQAHVSLLAKTWTTGLYSPKVSL